MPAGVRRSTMLAPGWSRTPPEAEPVEMMWGGRSNPFALFYAYGLPATRVYHRRASRSVKASVHCYPEGYNCWDVRPLFPFARR